MRRIWLFCILGIATLGLGFHSFGQVLATNWLALVVKQQVFHFPSRLLSQAPPGTVLRTIAPNKFTRLWGQWLFDQGNYEGAQNTFVPELEADSLDSMSMVVYAATEEQLGNNVGALNGWKRAGAFQQLFLRGQEAVTAEEWERASAYLDAAWSIAPANSVLVEAWVGMDESQPNLPQAEMVLQQAIQLHPGMESIPWRMRLGQILEKEEKWPEAESVYREIIMLSPKHDQAILGLARCLYYMQHDLAAAVTLVDQVLERSPKSSEAYGMLGMLYRAEKLYDQALESYTRQAELTPDSYWPLAQQAAVLMDKGDIQDAIRVLEAASVRFPDQPHCYYLLSYAYRRSGQTERAIEAARHAVDMNASNIGYQLQLANLYESGGYIEQAITAYEAILTINPEQHEALEAIQRLRSIP